MTQRRALITNDDGIDSPGLCALAEVAVAAGLETVVAAPGWDSSGASASLTAVQEDGRVVAKRAAMPGLADVTAYCVEAAPAFIVRAALHGGFGDPPDVVLSGINRGPNTGYAVLHSGTVGAALTAATYNCRALAASIGVGSAYAWEAAQRVISPVLERLLDCEHPTVLNVNVPNRVDVLGIRSATLAAFGAVQTHVTESGKGHVKISYTEFDADHEPGTDATYLAEGYATVTSLKPVCVDASIEADAFTFDLGVRV